MFKRMHAIVLLGLLVLVLAPAVQAHEGDAVLARIDADAAAGRFDTDQALLYKLQYVFDRDALPAEYVPEGVAPVKCATPLLMEFERRRATLPSEMVDQVDDYLRVGGDKATYISPSGHFRMTYLTTGTNAVSAVDVSPANGVPDYVELCAQYMDTSWNTEVDVLGFNAPPTSPYYEVSFENMGSYGYTTVVSGTTTRMVLENDFAGFPANDDPDGDALGAAKVTCAHEFKHATQRATSLWSEGGWVEVDAVWAEEVVFDAANDYYNYLSAGSGISSPATSLDGGSTGTGSYEDCIWQIWMSETWGNDLIVDLWDWRAGHTTQSMLASYNYILTTQGSSISAGFPLYAAWNYATRTRIIAGFGYSEGGSYPTSAVTNNTVYPYSGSGTVNHLASNNIHCTGFVPGEAGNLRIQFNGDNTADMSLIAVIKENSGSSSWQIIPLDAANDADLELSVPLGSLNRVGFVIANAAQIGDNKTWTLDLSKIVDLPDPAVQLSSASLSETLETDQSSVQPLLVTNNGEAGSVLDFEVHLMSAPPVLKHAAAPAVAVPAKFAPSGLRDAEIQSASRYTGDCVFGNSDTSDILGYYGSWWAGSETYATRINPADYACGCNPGFNVRAIHMLLYLETTSTPTVQVHLASAPAGCSAPGAILDSSTPVSISGITANGYYDIEVPCDLACQDMGSEYFLLFEFLDANGPVGIPIDSTPQSCVNWNDWGTGYEDVVDGYGFQGDWFIWADIDCCGVAEPEVSVIVPNGDELVAIGSTPEVTWTASVVTDVKVEFSRDNGANWELLSASTPNDGVETFLVTGPASTECLVRVSTLDDLYSDVSDAPFTIYDAVPWLSCTPTTASLAQGAFSPLTLGFDSTGLADDVYTGYLVIISNAGTSPDVVPVTLTVDTGTAVGDTPFAFGVDGNVPNPFNPSTEIRFQLETAGHAVVEVLDLQGRVVRTLHSGDLPAGPATLSWDGRDAAGRRVASGAYLARLVAGERTATHKMILAK